MGTIKLLEAKNTELLQARLHVDAELQQVVHVLREHVCESMLHMRGKCRSVQECEAHCTPVALVSSASRSLQYVLQCDAHFISELLVAARLLQY